MWVIVNGSCKRSLWEPARVTKMLQAENGQKVDDFQPIFIGKYRF